MKISLAIMAHPKRKEAATALSLELGQYPFAAPQIIWDEINEEWHTGKRALQYGIGKADWHVVIQDDALLTPDFYRNVQNAILGVPHKTLISLYTGTARPLAGRVRAAIENSPDGSWLAFKQLLWGVGIAIPSDHIEPMLAFVEDVELKYDNKIGEFYCRQGMPVYYTVPSLVDHDDDTDSLLPGHGRAIDQEPRKAHRLAGGLIEWTKNERYI